MRLGTKVKNLLGWASCNANKLNYYPKEIPDYPGVALKDLKQDDVITIRVFFGIGKGKKMRVV
ncbi:MAG: hypothetical protein ACI8PB_000013 [Desulforhopalus sp.]